MRGGEIARAREGGGILMTRRKNLREPVRRQAETAAILKALQHLHEEPDRQSGHAQPPLDRLANVVGIWSRPVRREGAMNTFVQTQFEGNRGGLRDVIPLREKITPETFEREREKIFKKSWLMIGHLSDLPESGSYFVRELPVVNASLIVVRGRDGVIRSFQNICRHRGNKLIRAGEGCKSTITCGFHGWTWSNTGELVGVTDESQFQNLDKPKLGLIEVKTATWQDFVFVNFDPAAASIEEWLGELAHGYDGYFQGQQKYARYRIRVRCNWNLAVNSFTEGYHTAYIHRNTAPDYQGGKKNPQRHRPFMQLLARHARYTAPANPDHKLSAAEAIAWKYGPTLFPAADFDYAGMAPALNPGRTEHWLFDVIEWFPNVLLLPGKHYHIELEFWPLSADETDITMTAFAYPPQTYAQRISLEFFRTRLREVAREDMNTLEAQHAAISTGAMQDVFLSQQELVLAHHYRVSEQMLNA
jgi:glycine betaine catabolism A